MSATEERLRDILKYGSAQKTLFVSSDLLEEVTGILSSLYGWNPIPVEVPEHWQLEGITNMIIGWDRDCGRPDIPFRGAVNGG